MLLEDSAKKWQNSFFYVSNLGADHINMPPFVDVTPQRRTICSYFPKNPLQDVLNLCAWVAEMKAREGLTSTDLIAAFIMRRVLLLQRRTHIISDMNGLQDPNRMSPRRLLVEQIASQVNDISKAGLKEEWWFGKPPYSHGNPTPTVSPWSLFFASAHLLIRPEATKEVLLNTIRHPYDRVMTHVVQVGSEDAAVLLEESEAADADAGTMSQAGKFPRLDFL
ncbi:uncharacterized protein [Triticum aestivum]|uniref:uncharacterized protein n=1 Tax=Triticum aestivum TaxID=4565 RepID=UPI001D0347CA|nr:uncharacterized protein LOC123110917 [Triticum aestivum]XP_044387492.1 uncharacterized protein LOC123110917 [Triticum aestivum]XP_044387493.1 uncharacterized protein LOC123110917 [Triticum aestivum]